MKNQEKNMVEIIAHLKNSGFVYQGSEIYGGLSNTWDYGPLGSLLKDNIAKEWKRFFIYKNPNMFYIDSKILMNPNVWVASGHVQNFSDPLIENKTNGKRYRADKIISEFDSKIVPEKMNFKEMENFLKKYVTEYDGVKTNWTSIRQFNLMFETKQGVVEDKKDLIYLRPETAQGIFVNYKNVQRTTRAKLPFGIGQIGKSFRNEVTPGNFIFRTREFEQMELEIFCKKEESTQIYKQNIKKCYEFLLKLGILKDNLRLREHEIEELSHYSKGTTDIEYLFPFGWGELLGIANRGNYDLSVHSKHSGEDLNYFDLDTNQKIVPYVIEPSIGLDRLMLAILIDSYDVETLKDDNRIVLRLNYEVAPYKIAILPLVKKLNEQAIKIYQDLLDKNILCTFDDAGSIGKRYRRQDAIGTPYCITFDYDSLSDNKITIRDRDTMKQERVFISEIEKYINSQR